MNGADWSDEDIEKLKRLWAPQAGGRVIKVTEICAIMKRGRNSILGKVHRLGLPGRASPIKRGDGTPRPAPAPKAARMPAPPKSIPDPPPGPQLNAQAPCNWPLGEPCTPSFRYCDKPTVRGTPYCPDHCQKAYLSERHKRAADSRAGIPPAERKTPTEPK